MNGKLTLVVSPEAPQSLSYNRDIVLPKRQ